MKSHPHSRFGLRLALVPSTLVACFALLVLVAPCQAQSKATRWEGSWNNKKYNTKGPLQAVIAPAAGGNLKATFTGTGIRSKFSFDANITKSTKNNRVALSGKTRINGDDYTWTGSAGAAALVGNYRSRSGNNGTFTLKMVKR